MRGAILYYTDHHIDPRLMQTCQQQLQAVATGRHIISVSLQPMDFGDNIVLALKSGYSTLLKQILAGLEAATAEVIWLTEHDCLYPVSHFDFEPPRDDTYYYNANVYRWQFGTDKAITYDRLISLSGLCCDRELALRHFERRLDAIAAMPKEERELRDPYWARKWGYEPGTKPRRKGGFSDEPFETWRSEEPIIDIRHDGCFSPKKVSLGSFRHQPTGWRECGVDDVPGWNLRELFGG